MSSKSSATPSTPSSKYSKPELSEFVNCLYFQVPFNVEDILVYISDDKARPITKKEWASLAYSSDVIRLQFDVGVGLTQIYSFNAPNGQDYFTVRDLLLIFSSYYNKDFTQQDITRFMFKYARTCCIDTYQAFKDMHGLSRTDLLDGRVYYTGLQQVKGSNVYRIRLDS